MKLGCDAIAPRTDLLKKATKRAFTQTSRAENFGNAQRQREWHEDAQIFYCLLPPVFQVPRLAKKGIKKKKKALNAATRNPAQVSPLLQGITPD